jgi:uncharacterized protein (TIGR00369 family)
MSRADDTSARDQPGRRNQSGSEDQPGRLVPNPYVGNAEYHCFGCDPENPAGLQLRFRVEGDLVWSEWTPRELLEGYPGVIHGGIQATLADEIGGWFLHAARGTAGMTRDLQISYHNPAYAADGPFRIEARPVEESAKSAVIEVTIAGTSGTVFSTARVTYAVFSEAVARRRLSFPGREAFLPTDE